MLNNRKREAWKNFQGLAVVMRWFRCVGKRVRKSRGDGRVMEGKEERSRLGRGAWGKEGGHG